MPSTKRNNSAFRSGPFSNSGIKSRTHLLASRSTTPLEGHLRFQGFGGFGIVRIDVFIVTKMCVLDKQYLCSYDNVNPGKRGPKEGSYVRYVADRSHPEVVRRHGRREYFQIAPGR